MADVIEELNPTDAESAKRSILYGSATTFCCRAPKNGSRKYISTFTAPIAWLAIIPKTPAAVVITAISVGRATIMLLILLSLSSCYGCPSKWGRMFSGSVERQFSPDDYI